MRPLVFALLSCSSICASAQVSIGNSFGFTYTRFRFDVIDDDLRDMVEKSANHCPGFTASLPVQMELSPRFALQPELAYTEKGIQYGDEPGQRIRLTYGEVHMLAKLTLVSSRARLFLLAGPSLGKGLLVTYHSPQFYYGDGVSASEFDDKGTYRPYEFGALSGLGFGVRAGRGWVDLEARYLYGLTTIYNKDVSVADVNGQFYKEAFNACNAGFIFQLGYLFPMGCKDAAPASPPAQK